MKLDFVKLQGVVPAALQDHRSGRVLMLGFMNEEAFQRTVETGFATFFGARAVEVHDKLSAAGVLVRDRGYELAGCVRITVGTREQTTHFLSELERIWR